MIILILDIYYISNNALKSFIDVSTKYSEINILFIH